MKVLYTGNTTVSATGVNEGRAVSDDGLLDVKLAPPKQLGGNGDATNPEQLFAAAYAACFISMLKFVGRRDTIDVPADLSVTGSVGIGLRDDGGGFGLTVTLTVTLPGLDRAVAEELVTRTRQVCPYSHAIQGNITVDTVIM